jgi:hypothetical protein
MVIVSLSLVVNACSTISPYSETAYQQATSLKAESLALIEKANEPYSAHSQEVAALKLELAKAEAYAQGRPHNELSTEQWSLLIDPQGHSLGGFFTRWENQGTLSPTFIAEAKDEISAQFDTISGLESGKTKEGN